MYNCCRPREVYVRTVLNPRNQFALSACILTILKGRSSMSGWESIGFSGEVDPPLDGHKIEIAQMLTLRCKSGEIGSSSFVHLTERILVIHWREQGPRL